MTAVHRGTIGAMGTQPDTIAGHVADARARTLELVADLADTQLMGPRLAIVNPLLWEIGHVAWFQDHWVRRHGLGQALLRSDGDALYDSSAIHHDTRWDLPLPSRADTLDYLNRVRDRVLSCLASGEATPRLLYLALYTVFHEDMHDEAFLYTRQTLGYPAPGQPQRAGAAAAGPLAGDAPIPGGRFLLGSTADETFVFDNEKWAHEVEVAPFRIARAPVTQAEFAAFVEDGGYRRVTLWTPAGADWLRGAAAGHPVHWRRVNGGWERRDFDRWMPLEPHRPVIHVNWFEAEAYSAWAGRRLPTEAEWEAAAALEPNSGGTGFAARKRRFPWGEDAPTADRANLDGRALGCVDVGALPAGDSAFGCRQMIGNVWEWTADAFQPYPGFVPDMYADYSQPWFGTHKVLRGGCWATRARLLRNAWRNFYPPDRRDVWAGFRTCAR
jgi:gamma-glutamyl hercynylcysteine S-oxide synthase